GLVHEQALTLARRLCDLLPENLTRVFFSDSGAVAVEVAMKMAVQYWLNKGVRGRTKMLAFKGGYHGDTFATMAVCDPEEGMHALFRDVLAAQVIADLPGDEASGAPCEEILGGRRHGVSSARGAAPAAGGGGPAWAAADFR